jgi:hypothetical protein
VSGDSLSAYMSSVVHPNEKGHQITVDEILWCYEIYIIELFCSFDDNIKLSEIFSQVVGDLFKIILKLQTYQESGNFNSILIMWE